MRDYIFELPCGGEPQVCGKDGRCYPHAQVIDAEVRAATGDAAARAFLAMVDFGLHDDGAPRSADETVAAMRVFHVARTSAGGPAGPGVRRWRDAPTVPGTRARWMMRTMAERTGEAVRQGGWRRCDAS